MPPLLFLNKYYSDAKAIEKKYGISAIFLLAQSAHETGWGKNTPGNMMFGIKAGEGATTQKKETWECTKTGEEIISTLPPPNQPCGNITAYKVYALFNKYNSPKDSFEDYYRFLSGNSRYAKALLVKNIPERMAEEIARAGYATDPDYAGKLKSTISKVNSYWTVVEAAQTSLRFARRNRWILIILLFLLLATVILIRYRKFLTSKFL